MGSSGSRLLPFTLFAVSLVFALTGCSRQKPAPESENASPRVAVKGRQLLVDGRPFIMRGFDYTSCPVGKDFNHCWSVNPEEYEEDFARIEAMNANTIRLFGAEPYTDTMLDAARRHGLRVILGYWVHEKDLGDTSRRERMKREFVAMIRRYRHHPAVLMWVFGCEVNGRIPAEMKPTWYRLVNEACARGKAEDSRPMTTANLGSADIGQEAFHSDDASMTSLDLWGVNEFWHPSLGGMLDNVYWSSKKPIWSEQVGIEAFNAATGREDEEMQAAFLEGMWRSVLPHLSATNEDGIYVGLTFFEWSDEWWKSSGRDLRSHDTAADWYCDPYPDSSIQEEWFGIAAIAPDTTARRLRAAYERLGRCWAELPR